MIVSRQNKSLFFHSNRRCHDGRDDNKTKEKNMSSTALSVANMEIVAVMLVYVVIQIIIVVLCIKNRVSLSVAFLFNLTVTICFLGVMPTIISNILAAAKNLCFCPCR